ncbi:MAG TPA: glycoside hydrolase family 31 protein, partial [Phnomibacter sp.]|nr:glycoside hydrolase family 31 protein [Phnomibacter sp.]
GGIVNLFSKKAREWFWQYYKKQNDIGVAGWWGDLGEPEYHPTGIKYDMSDLGIKRKMDAHEVHNIYGHYWSQMVYEHWTRDHPDKRLFFLNRAGYAGSQRYSIFPWTGDVGRNWSGLRAQLNALQSTSLSGIPYIHSDAGGFAMTDTADAELYLRWLQFAAYTPVFRPHGSALDDLGPEGTISLPSEPTFWDEKTKARALKLIRERYHLLPYHYTMAWEHTHFGKPLIRPMLLHHPADTNLLAATDQYMWGGALLVAPVLHPGVDTRKLYLPQGVWYRLHDLSTEMGERWIEERTAPDRIPVFVKGGSFLPWWEKHDVRSTAEYAPSDTLCIRYYPGQSGQPSFVYDDDGAKPDANNDRDGYQLMEWTSHRTGNTLEIKGMTASWTKGVSRVLKIQVPMRALKSYLGAGEQDKMTITLNGKVYAAQSIALTGKMDSWANMYVTVDGGPVDLRITMKK